MDIRFKNRVLQEANYIIKTNETIRNTAQVFGISKSLVHKDIHLKLRRIDNELYEKVIKILNNHKKIKHILGGLSTKLKYKRGIL